MQRSDGAAPPKASRHDVTLRQVRTTHAGVLQSPQLIGGLRAGQHQRRHFARQTATARDLQCRDEHGVKHGQVDIHLPLLQHDSFKEPNTTSCRNAATSGKSSCTLSAPPAAGRPAAHPPAAAPPPTRMPPRPPPPAPAPPCAAAGRTLQEVRRTTLMLTSSAACHTPRRTACPRCQQRTTTGEPSNACGTPGRPAEASTASKASDSEGCWRGGRRTAAPQRTLAARQHGGVLAGEVGAGERQQRAVAALAACREARRQRQHARVYALAAGDAQHVQQAAVPHQGHLVEQLQLQHDIMQ